LILLAIPEAASTIRELATFGRAETLAGRACRAAGAEFTMSCCATTSIRRAGMDSEE